jgi:uncharacterized RDD family membrane protein YckC
LERNVLVRTPESIAFYYELAGLGSRFLAVALDFIIQTVAVIVVALLFAWATPGIQALAKILRVNDAAFGAVIVAVTILFLFLLYFGYFIAFEVLWNGQTPGKRLIGIRVVRDGGYPVTFMDVVVRNFIRVIEFALAYIPSIVSALISSQNKRLGDLAAGTIVVRDRAFDVPDSQRWFTADSDAAATPLPGLDRITDDEFALAERYIARSHMLDRDAAAVTAGRIAGALRSKLGPEASQYSDHELLLRIAAGRPR